MVALGGGLLLTIEYGEALTVDWWIQEHLDLKMDGQLNLGGQRDQ